MQGIRRNWRTGVALLFILALAIGLGCRKELPELFDRNQAPETYITSAPVESLFDGFRIHLRWYGRDPDGEIAYFLWSWTDSSRAYYNAWNPETRAGDRILEPINPNEPEDIFDKTNLTTRRDSTFTLPANDSGGTSRDLTFNITAVDDKGKRDPMPARLYFSASVDGRPAISWLLEAPPEVPELWVTTDPETIDTGQPFACGFTGSTVNGYVLGYQWKHGTELLFWPRNENGDPIWTYQLPEDHEMADIDTIILVFDNDITGQSPEMEQYYRTGTFMIKAKCIDLAGVQSDISTDLNNLKGVLVPILNRDPDTRLRPHDGDDYPLVVRYTVEEGEPQETINLSVRQLTPEEHPGLPIGYHYAVEDTIPWGQNTWITVNMQGWDMDNPVSAHPDSIETRFQMGYTWTTPNLTNFQPIVADSRELYPASGCGGAVGFPEELDLPFPHWGAAGQHYEMNLLCADYIVRGHTLDHYLRKDGTPFTVRFTAGFSSCVDSIILSSLDAEGSTSSVEILNREPGEEVNIELIAVPSVPPPSFRFIWNEETNTAAVYPIIYEGPPGPPDEDSTCEFDLLLRVYGHDDPRNGAKAQVGRIWWNLLDPDYDNSTHQFVSEHYWLDEGGFLKIWTDLWDEEDPAEEGVMTFRLRIKENYLTMLEEGSTPDWLGEKEILTRFCNTRSSENHEAFIEDVSQRRFQLVNIGRMSPERAANLSIVYGTP